MQIQKAQDRLRMKTRKYILYAIGEIILIVMGILLALFINNQNLNYKYKSQIDNNLERAYYELESNIGLARQIIGKFQEMDSVIRLVMNDSLTRADYRGNLRLGYLIIYFDQLELEDKAFQNLIQLNIAENKYKEGFIEKFKGLYAINQNIIEANERISSFVYEESIPLLGERITSFGDLTYKGVIQDDAIDYFLNDKEYKSYTSQYAIIAIKNQLRFAEIFYKRALGVYQQIGAAYGFPRKDTLLLEAVKQASHQGTYVNVQYRDTMQLSWEGDTLSLGRKRGFNVPLVPVDPNRFFSDNQGSGYFVSFYPAGKNDSTPQMKIHLLARELFYEKLSD